MKEHKRPKDSPISVWKETDSLNGSEVSVLVVILNTPGCCWSKKGGCTMCGYNFDTDTRPTSTDDYLSQMDRALEKYAGEPYIKIFTSGSFLDPGEIQEDAQTKLVEMIRDRCGDVRLLIESRPEFITRERITRLSDILGELEIAIGLETVSDGIRAERIRKGFDLDDYLKAGRTIVGSGLYLKTYLLLKPPLMSEGDSITDALRSIKFISDQFPGSRISINPMNIQKGTAVERLFNRGLYKPPWLWTVSETLLAGHEKTGGKVHLMSSPTAGGKRRGAHNCGKCDEAVLKGIERFSIDNDPSHLQMDCPCREGIWSRMKNAGILSPSGFDLVDPRES
ncbi:MAG: archaeosine biosynthesis radical SAM protein RaSEA [Thermoplasmatota archaeon]